MRRTTALTLALTLLMAALVPAMAPAGADTLTAIDEGTALADSDAGEDYREDGAVRDAIPGLNASIAVLDDHDAAGLEGIHRDAGRHFVRLQYNESIDRRLRIYVHRSVWHPHLKEDVEALESAETASLAAVADGEYTAVTVTVDGPTDTVFPVSAAAARFLELKDRGRSWLENQTGWDLPSILGAETAWQYPASTALSAENTTVAINTTKPLTIQYDAIAGAGERWLSVPQCADARDDTPVCRLDRSANQTLVLSRAPNATAIRYRIGDAGPLTEVRAAVNELLEAPGRVLDELQELTGDLL